jgi:hypothetical protein
MPKNSDLLKKSSTYLATEPTMLAYQRAYLGGELFKRSVRKKRPSEDVNIYSDILHNTAALPVARYVVDTINNTVFSDQMYRDLAFADPQGIELAETDILWTELMLYDADLSGQSFNAIMEQISELSSIFGHTWVFIDMPTVDQGASGRPYIVPVSPLDVWDWSFTPVNGRYIPRYVKVKENETPYDIHFKCYHIGSENAPSYWESYRVEKGSDAEAPAQLTGTGLFPAGMSIPAFISYTRRDPRSIEFGISDIDSASDVQREHYKLECEAYSSLSFARTLIRADAGIKIPAHAGGIVRGVAGSIETLNVDTQDVATIIAKQTDLMMTFETLSGFGGLRQNKRLNQSGVSMIEERRSLHKIASSKARLLEITEEMIWTFAARYMGQRWAGEINYGTDYEAHDTQYRVSILETAQKLSGDNPVIKGIIDRSVLSLLVDDDEAPLYEMKMVQMDKNTAAVEEAGEATEVETRDVGPQTPATLQPESAAKTDGTGYSGIVQTGMSSYNPIADQLLTIGAGR